MFFKKLADGLRLGLAFGRFGISHRLKNQKMGIFQSDDCGQ